MSPVPVFTLKQNKARKHAFFTLFCWVNRRRGVRSVFRTFMCDTSLDLERRAENFDTSLGSLLHFQP